MAKILYPQVITEDLDELKELEKYHRYSHLFQRLRMLRLLKSEECSNLGEAARALGYSWRQCQRWFASYQKGGIEELLKSRVHERGRQELATPEALEDLKETDGSPLFVPALMRVPLPIVAPSRSPHLRLTTCTTPRTPKASGSPERCAAEADYGARGNPRPAPSLPPSRRMPPF